MRKRRGRCAICGEVKDLTFEHIPPRRAYNDRTVSVLRGDKALNRRLDEVVQGQLQQRGSGAWITCADCNAKSGRWYVREYAQWVERGVDVLSKLGDADAQDARTDPRIIAVPFEGVRPLLFLKQVVYMILAVNGAGFSTAHPDLRRFVLNRDATGMSDACHFYLALTWGPGSRFVGITGAGGRNGVSLLSEVAFPPFSCVMCLEQPWHGLPVCDISEFARFTCTETTDIVMPLLLGFTHLVLPSDYRSRASIEGAVEMNQSKRGVSEQQGE